MPSSKWSCVPLLLTSPKTVPLMVPGDACAMAKVWVAEPPVVIVPVTGVEVVQENASGTASVREYEPVLANRRAVPDESVATVCPPGVMVNCADCLHGSPESFVLLPFRSVNTLAVTQPPATAVSANERLALGPMVTTK